MITAGYLGGPSGNPSAQAVQWDPTVAANCSGIVSVRLLQAYYPVDYSTGLSGIGPGGFRDFGVGGGAVPYRCVAGQAISVPKGEAAQLLQLGAAAPV